jgi:protein SCO1/2
MQTAAMAKLQEEFKDKSDLIFVSISVDPERDDPETLSKYAARFKADPRRWLFLTGDKNAIYRLAREGFRLSAAPLGSKDADGFVHSSRFVLVDRKAQIRGYYESRDTEALRRLRVDLGAYLHSQT